MNIWQNLAVFLSDKEIKIDTTAYQFQIMAIYYLSKL